LKEANDTTTWEATERENSIIMASWVCYCTHSCNDYHQLVWFAALLDERLRSIHLSVRFITGFGAVNCQNRPLNITQCRYHKFHTMIHIYMPASCQDRSQSIIRDQDTLASRQCCHVMVGNRVLLTATDVIDIS
jgi:hypothetical protein